MLWDFEIQTDPIIKLGSSHCKQRKEDVSVDVTVPADQYVKLNVLLESFLALALVDGFSVE